MAKILSVYVCQACGARTPKWSGKCGACGEWDSILEERMERQDAKRSAKRSPLVLQSLDGIAAEAKRSYTQIGELDRVLGGGFVEGAVVLVGGDPGIGKSTLMLQALAALSRQGRSTVYITGEESIEQVRLRAQRLQLHTAPVRLLSATNVDDILATLLADAVPDVVVIDSIQTMYTEIIESAPGTVSQVRSASYALMQYAKRYGATLVLVGHVTKDGQLAGPKVLEHMVDTVLYFEGERGHHFRILRAVKNRFGAANEIGVFEMGGVGLQEVSNPSSMFLGSREHAVSGSVVFAGMEGTRTMLVEIQALIFPSMLATPRRAVVGWDTNRLAMVIAVLGARYGVSLANKEVYLNVAGGLQIEEPAADLAVACALLSALSDRPAPEGTVIFGELGLSGEVRPVPQYEARLKEALKLGFSKAIVPVIPALQNNSFDLQEILHIRELARFFPIPSPARNDAVSDRSSPSFAE